MTFCSIALENKGIQSTLTSLASYEQTMSDILGDCWGNYKYGDYICKSHVREIIGHCCLYHAISVVMKEIAVDYRIITILNFDNSRLSKNVLKHKSYYLIFPGSSVTIPANFCVCVCVRAFDKSIAIMG